MGECLGRGRDREILTRAFYCLNSIHFIRSEKMNGLKIESALKCFNAVFLFPTHILVFVSSYQIIPNK